MRSYIHSYAKRTSTDGLVLNMKILVNQYKMNYVTSIFLLIIELHSFLRLDFLSTSPKMKLAKVSGTRRFILQVSLYIVLTWTFSQTPLHSELKHFVRNLLHLIDNLNRRFNKILDNTKKLFPKWTTRVWLSGALYIVHSIYSC